MTNYKKMYFALFNAVTDALRDLQEAQQAGEESYLEVGDNLPVVLPSHTDKRETAAE